MKNADVVKDIALWALTCRHESVGDFFDMSDEELAKLLSWLKEDVEGRRQTHSPLGQVLVGLDQLKRIVDRLDKISERIDAVEEGTA